MSEDYIQHNPTVPTGRQGFVEFFCQFEQESVQCRVVLLFAENYMVVFAFKRELPDPNHRGEPYITTRFDMFRIKDEKIVEHWDFACNCFTYS